MRVGLFSGNVRNTGIERTSCHQSFHIFCFGLYVLPVAKHKTHRLSKRKVFHGSQGRKFASLCGWDSAPKETVARSHLAPISMDFMRFPRFSWISGVGCLPAFADRILLLKKQTFARFQLAASIDSSIHRCWRLAGWLAGLLGRWLAGWLVGWLAAVKCHFLVT